MQSAETPKQKPVARLKKNTYRFNMGNSTSTREIFISSNFDSGNIELIKQVTETHVTPNINKYRLAPVPDYDTQSRTKKTWFYFKARAPRYVKLKIVIENVQILVAGYQAERTTAKPVYRVGDDGEWLRLSDCYLSYRQELEIQIQHTFMTEENVYFALSTPFSYLENNDYLLQLQSKVRQDVYFNKQILTYSANQLIVNLLTITHNHQINQIVPGNACVLEDKINDNMFPDQNRPIKINKPVVLILCRVHPGETSASHTLVGMLNFLCLSDDPRAYLLRRLFVFMVVPMVNPDGVYEGNYRMDTLSVNLNRIYNNPSPEQHPSVFAITKLVEHLNSQQRLNFFFDMHGHSSSRGAFIYGNAFDNIVSQVESQVFCKVVSMNSKYFQYEACNFSERHMKVRDKNEPLTKEGCARVVFGKSSGIIHALTIESGLHTIEPQKMNILPQLTNMEFRLSFQEKIPSVRKYHTDDYQQMNYELGENILVSILDVVEKNPYSRIPNSEHKTLEALRRSLATELLQEEERFKMLDLKAYQKTKSITRYIQEAFIDKIQRKWSYYLDDLAILPWPQGFEGFKPAKKERLSISKQPKPSKKPTIQTIITNQNNEIPTLQATLTIKPNTDNAPRTLVKSLSPMQRQSTARNFIQEDVMKVNRTNLRLEYKGSDLFKKAGFQNNTSTRKLLRDLRNEKSKGEIITILEAGTIKTEPSTHMITDQSKSRSNAITSISEESDILFSAENKDMLQIRLQNRARHLGNCNNIKHRVKTQIGNPSTFDSIANPLVVKSNSKPAVRELQTEIDTIESILQRKITMDPVSLDNRMKKIRSSKRQIINLKLSEIRKKSDKGNLLRLPEIKRLRYQLSTCSKLQDEQLALATETVPIVLQIETIKIIASKNSIKDIRP